MHADNPDLYGPGGGGHLICLEEENFVIRNSSYEAAQQFCYLGDMLSTGSRAGSKLGHSHKVCLEEVS